jgi:pentatricopeptide repeat protein
MQNVKPDRVIFNTLINACSRAGAVQRAFDVLTDMNSEATPVKPDHVTYGALISACARGGEVASARYACSLSGVSSTHTTQMQMV